MSVAVEPAVETLARGLVDARLAARSLRDFPGRVPDSLDQAHAVQHAAISLWPDEIAGWKVGRLSPDLAARHGVHRFIGPVFRAGIIHAPAAGLADFPIFVGGSAAFEAEFVVEAADDGQGQVVPGRLMIGIEIAASPIANLPVLGSCATIADFGNNAGLILGPELALERFSTPDLLECATRIDGSAPVAASAESLPGGVAGAFRFAVSEAARLGHPLRPGQFVSTGAVTGIHPVTLGQLCEADFGADGALRCRVVARSPVC